MDEKRAGGRPGESRLVDVDQGESFAFAGPVIVGRHPTCDLVLDHPRVSSRHAAIDWDGARWLLRDLRSKNGTSLNHRRVHEQRALRQGDTLRFGGVVRWRVEQLAPPAERWVQGATETAARRLAAADIDLQLRTDGAGEGIVRVTAVGARWQERHGQRFVLLYVLAEAQGDWVEDEALKISLWGRAGAASVDPSALHKLIHDARRMFARRGVHGVVIEKAHGRTRLRLPPERVELVG